MNNLNLNLNYASLDHSQSKQGSRTQRGQPSDQMASFKYSFGRYEYDPIDFQYFKKYVKFINAEWGVEVDIMCSPNDEIVFKDKMEQNTRRQGMAMITFKDISRAFLDKFKVKGQDTKMVRFLDAHKLSVLTKNDHVIYSRKLIQEKDFKPVTIII